MATAGASENTVRSAAAGTMSSFWMNFTPSATSCAQPWKAPASIGPDARLHVREHLVLDVAHHQRHHQEEDQHHGGLQDQRRSRSCGPVVEDGDAAWWRSLVLVLLALDGAGPRLGLAGHQGEVLAQRDGPRTARRAAASRAADGPRSGSRTSRASRARASRRWGTGRTPWGTTGSSCGQADLHPHVVVVRGGEQVRHDLEPALGAPVHAAGEVAVVAGELGLVAQEPHEVAVALRA